jgi:Protein of unknown function (DUF1566)
MLLLAKKPLIVLLALTALLAGQVHASCNSGIQLTKPNSVYIDNHDGTVTDNETGLIWAKCSLGQSWTENIPNDGSDDLCSGEAATYTWRSALEAAQSANRNSYLGQSDWRVPNKNELESLVESACYDPAINSSRFPAKPSVLYWPGAPYWTSSPAYADHLMAWFVDFKEGFVSILHKNNSYFLRVVRDDY